ncbi:hypothetical protein CAPTEDRAFT_185047 [Capitella teleta]|uniref:DDE Tnp4 domain-containing protein n=1 Tax=Capitella teleta TaxID=283909 RepID=R7U4V8_CAPTE|nr:hypothetical protein CAPTEDRAFT_185047 [Capitella teleta]|eukprot:ELU00974.1 hypothetical protein CAPTEDRAFT_185047 [Capitella teleta]
MYTFVLFQVLFRYVLYLMILKMPQDCNESAYNTACKRARSIVEQSIGLLKMKFRILHKTTGVIHTHLETTYDAIVACAVLHNLVIDDGVDYVSQSPWFWAYSIEGRNFPVSPHRVEHSKSNKLRSTVCLSGTLK